jgi:hypothetical protein
VAKAIIGVLLIKSASHLKKMLAPWVVLQQMPLVAVRLLVLV